MNQDLEAGKVPGINRIKYTNESGISEIISASDETKEITASEILRFYKVPRGTFPWLTRTLGIEKARRGVYRITSKIDRELRVRYKV